MRWENSNYMSYHIDFGALIHSLSLFNFALFSRFNFDFADRRRSPPPPLLLTIDNHSLFIHFPYFRITAHHPLPITHQLTFKSISMPPLPALMHRNHGVHRPKFVPDSRSAMNQTKLNCNRFSSIYLFRWRWTWDLPWLLLQKFW